jgi:ABC-type proline/glycine betaine transport system substrate-binding protein
LSACQRLILKATSTSTFSKGGKQIFWTTIKQGRIDLSFHHVAGEVFKLVLERLGYNVQVESAPHEAAFALHQEAKVDFLIAWLEGSHGEYTQPINGT